MNPVCWIGEKDCDCSTDVVVQVAIQLGKVAEWVFSVFANFPKFSPIIQKHAGRQIAYAKLHLGANECPISDEMRSSPDDLQ